MNLNEKINYWIKSAESDLSAAELLFNNEKYLHMSFFCHLMVEKYLKAYHWHKIKEEPPYIHNLIKLAQISGLFETFSSSQKELISSLMPLNLKGRYPDESDTSLSLLTKEDFESIIL